MFAFQVKMKNGGPGEGSVVGPIYQYDGDSYVPVMWEDGWNFTDEKLEDILAVPQIPQGTEQENIVAFPGAEDPVH